MVGSGYLHLKKYNILNEVQLFAVGPNGGLRNSSAIVQLKPLLRNSSEKETYRPRAEAMPSLHHIPSSWLQIPNFKG